MYVCTAFALQMVRPLPDKIAVPFPEGELEIVSSIFYLFTLGVNTLTLK